MGMSRNALSRSRSRSRDTMAEAAAATAHSKNRLSGGSWGMVWSNSWGVTKRTRDGSVNTWAHWAKSCAWTKRPTTRRYSPRTSLESTNHTRPSRQALTTCQEEPRHRLEIGAFVSKTSLGRGTVADRPDQTRHVSWPNSCGRGGSPGASAQGVEAGPEALLRGLEPLDNGSQDLSLFNVFQLDFGHHSLTRFTDTYKYSTPASQLPPAIPRHGRMTQQGR